MTCTICEAKDKLYELIQAVKDGQPVTICEDNGQPVADLIPTGKRREVPKFGTLAGRGIIVDPDWHKGPKTDEELEAWLEGRFE